MAEQFYIGGGLGEQVGDAVHSKRGFADAAIAGAMSVGSLVYGAMTHSASAPALAPQVCETVKEAATVGVEALAPQVCETVKEAAKTTVGVGAAMASGGLSGLCSGIAVGAKLWSDGKTREVSKAGFSELGSKVDQLNEKVGEGGDRLLNSLGVNHMEIVDKLDRLNARLDKSPRVSRAKAAEPKPAHPGHVATITILIEKKKLALPDLSEFMVAGAVPRSVGDKLSAVRSMLNLPGGKSANLGENCYWTVEAQAVLRCMMLNQLNVRQAKKHQECRDLIARAMFDRDQLALCDDVSNMAIKDCGY